MSNRTKTSDAAEVAPSERKPAYVARWGRGRIGGTGALMLFGQRAIAQGRMVTFLDGDLKSGTLSAFYDGRCSRPPSMDPTDFRHWVLEDLDAMADDRTSRLLDVSGGSSSMEELLRDLELPGFCRANDIRFTWLCMLGPDVEDFQHVLTAVQAGHMRPADMLFVLNEGAIRQGQNPVGAFNSVTTHLDFVAMVQSGARPIYLTRLPVMDTLRRDRLDFYRVAAREPDAAGKRPPATASFMVQQWLRDVEQQLDSVDAVNWTP